MKPSRTNRRIVARSISARGSLGMCRSEAEGRGESWAVVVGGASLLGGGARLLAGGARLLGGDAIQSSAPTAIMVQNLTLVAVGLKMVWPLDFLAGPARGDINRIISIKSGPLPPSVVSKAKFLLITQYKNFR
jgi:hypothetical protein